MSEFTLLIVNDEKLTAETMRSAIFWESYGISTVYTAYEAEMAKAAIKTHKIDIMLCDIEMPGDNGLELLQWVNTSKYDIRCVFLTCHASFHYAQKAIGLDCEDYLLIPAKYEDIGNAVARVVDKICTQRQDRHYQEYGKHLLQERIKNTEEDHRGEETKKVTMDDVAGYILDSLQDSGLSVNSVADVFHFHPVYLNRVFKKEKGVSIGQFIIDSRMHTAAGYLMSGKFSVNEVAEQVGYRHYPNFHKMFKKNFDCSPSQYNGENFVNSDSYSPKNPE